MLDPFLKMKEPVQMVFSTLESSVRTTSEVKDQIQRMKLTEDEWNLLPKVQEVLAPLEEITIVMSSDSHPTSSLTFLL